MPNDTSELFRPGGFELTARGAQLAHICQNSYILDIGCGTGRSLSYLSDTCHCQVAGIDAAAKAIQRGRELLPSATFLLGDAEALPFPDQTFDAAFMECTLTLFADPVQALKEAYRVLKPGGYLILSAMSRLTGAQLIERGALCLPLLQNTVSEMGFHTIALEDHTSDLVQFVVDIIFTYGSIPAYLEQANATIDGTVLNCSVSPKNTHYHLLVLQR